MPAIRLTGFVGEWPARDNRALPDNAARNGAAVNMRPDGGAYLKGLRAPIKIKDLAETTNMVYRLPALANEALATSHWEEFADAFTDVVPSQIVNDSYDRFYWGSPGEGLLFNAREDIIDNSPVAYSLGVPRPINGVNINTTGGGAANGTLVLRSYTMTYVNIFGEEGPPAEAESEKGYDNGTWNVQSITPPPTGVALGGKAPIAKVRIYRTVTGFDGVTDFYFVSERDVADLSNFDDTKKDSVVASGAILESTTWVEPRSGCQGLAALPNGIFLSWGSPGGAKASTLFVSENYRPHAWPPEYEISVDDPIVGLGVFGNSCVICTNSRPAIVTGIKANALALIKIDQPMPCRSRRSIVPTPTGVYFASHEGLAFVSLEGARIVSEDIYTRPQWQGVLPQQFKSAATHKALLMANNVASGNQIKLYPIGQEASKGVITADLGADWMVDAMGIDRWSGKIWFIRDPAGTAGKELYEWDPTESVTVLPYLWGSKEIQLPRPVNFAAFQVYFDEAVEANPASSVSVLIEALLRGADGTLDWVTAFNGTVARSGQERRLASGFRSDVWRVRLIGTADVQSFIMATTVRELRSA